MKPTSIIIILVFLYCISMCSSADRVTFLEQNDAVEIQVDGKPFASYRFSDQLTKPILYPIYTPSGIKMTRGYPFEKVEGEAMDHPHHTGLFFTYDEVNGNGFWNNTYFPPQIRHHEIHLKESGQAGILKTESTWLDKDNQPLLLEKRSMTFIPGSDEVAIDFDMSLTALVDSVVFNDTKEGMFAIRVAQWLREEDQTGSYLSSNGDIGEKNVWGKRAKWVRLEGNQEGKQAGLVIMNHPESVNYPTYWHARAYGLFSANPLGQFVFQSARNDENPQKLLLTLEKGRSARFRFLVLVYDGTRSPAQLDARFEEYSR